MYGYFPIVYIWFVLFLLRIICSVYFYWKGVHLSDNLGIPANTLNTECNPTRILIISAFFLCMVNRFYYSTYYGKVVCYYNMSGIIHLY